MDLSSMHSTEYRKRSIGLLYKVQRNSYFFAKQSHVFFLSYVSLKITNKKTKTELAALAALRAICDTIALSQKGAPFLGNLSILVI